MLGGADTKKLFSLKMLDGAGAKETPFSQYVKRGLARKSCSTENMFAIKEAPQTQTRKSSFRVKL